MAGETRLSSRRSSPLSLGSYRFLERALWLSRGVITFACIVIGVVAAGHASSFWLVLLLSTAVGATWLGTTWASTHVARRAGMPLPFGGKLLALLTPSELSAPMWVAVAILAGTAPYEWLLFPAGLAIFMGTQRVRQRPLGRAITPNELPESALSLLGEHLPVPVTLLEVPDDRVGYLAGAAGWGRRSCILLRESLLTGDENELLMILAHEVMHHRRGDPRRAALLSALRLLIISLGGLVALILSGQASQTGVAPAFTSLLGFALTSAIVHPVWLSLSRQREWAAWVGAVRILNDGEQVARHAEMTIDTLRAERDPPRLVVLLRQTHPAPGRLIDMARSYQPPPAAWWP